MELVGIAIITVVIVLAILRTWTAPNDRYCPRCGAEKTQSVQYHYFDGKTGKKVTYDVRVCPNEERLFKLDVSEDRNIQSPDTIHRV